MRFNQSINYSKLFSQLVNKDGEMDDTIASFLYYLFPRELFIRALSLIESCDMFIYVLDPNRCHLDIKSTTSVGTDIDSPLSSHVEGSSGPITPAVVQKKPDSRTRDPGSLVSMVYESESELLNRLIVKSDSGSAPPIYVDLQNWFCSCDEYSDLFASETARNSQNQDTDYIEFLSNEVTDLQDFSDDRFAQLDAHSLSKQRYFLHDKVCCAHLVAYSLLLRSSKDVLHYFATVKGQVPMIRVSSMDEWLRLHINVVA